MSRETKFRNMVYREQHKDWVTYFYTLQDLVENSDMCVFEDVWEQYTGLKDENGKEIYEGDIVISEFDSEDGDYSYADKVIWDNENLRFSCSRDAYYENNLFRNCIVIGNIHENPELLVG